MMQTESSPGPVALERGDQLDQLVSESSTAPVFIFKHSPTCGTSYMALEEVDAALEECGDIRVHVVDVLSHRALSNDIARRFGVRHQSPQMLLLLDGSVRWNASHYSITASAIARALRDAGAVSTT